MLSYLRISNLAILDEVVLEPGPGLNVLTGETGAGKSIIVDAIGLLVGGRGGADLIRSGCERLVVEGQFDLTTRRDAAAIAALAGLDDEDAGELVIRRELHAAGRGRALVNGRLVTQSALRTLGEALADLHGQHQHQSLLRSDGQREALDLYAGALDLVRQVADLSARWRALEDERETLAGRERERARQDEMLGRQIAEIDAVAPAPGEDADLQRQESLLRHASEVAQCAARGFELISDDDDSVLARLGASEECAARLARIDAKAEEAVSAIREARLAASEAARVLSRYVGREEFDAARLEQVASRLAELDRLRRKYGESLADVLAYREQAAAELAALGGAAARLTEVAAEIAASKGRYLELAGELSATRRRAARRLEKAVEKELTALAMEGTRVEIAVDPDPLGVPADPRGIDTIAFLIAPNRGEELRPLSRIASGGELSRLMLAVRNAAQAGRTDQRTLIFDEVDSGVGGEVASVVGQRLAALGRAQQVLCVTHLPQIASLADRHFTVAKSAAGSRTRAELTRLDAQGRIEELARMLGGSPAETARRHAAALLRRPAGAAARRGEDGQ